MVFEFNMPKANRMCWSTKRIPGSSNGKEKSQGYLLTKRTIRVVNTIKVAHLASFVFIFILNEYIMLDISQWPFFLAFLLVATYLLSVNRRPVSSSSLRLVCE